MNDADEVIETAQGLDVGCYRLLNTSGTQMGLKVISGAGEQECGSLLMYWSRIGWRPLYARNVVRMSRQ